MRAQRHRPEGYNSAQAADLPPGHGDGLRLLALVDRAVWIYDFDHVRMVWANPAGLRFWRAESVAALCERDLNPTALGTAERLQNLRHALARGEVRSERWTFYPQGQPFQRDCRLHGVTLEDGRMALLVDAADAPMQVADSSFETRAIEAVRQSALMISLLSEGGQWLMHNPAAEALINRLHGTNLPGLDNFATLFAHPGEAIALRARALESGSAEATLRMAGSAFRMHEVTLRRLTDPVTGRLSLMVSQADVTRAYRAERRLHKALARERTIAETQRQFLSVTSHDFRTPLSMIDGSARRIARLAEPGSVIAERAETIRDTARRMTEAVDRTLGWASIEEGRVDFQPERAKIRPMVERALLAQRSVHPHRPFVAELDDVPDLMLDQVLVLRVLDNLIGNAIKYSPEEQPVRVRCCARNGEVMVSVTDEGIGIPSGELSKLFTRFFRSSNARRFKGSGVGLHAARFYMELHGGRISVKTTEGKGSTFTLAFPVPAKG